MYFNPYINKIIFQDLNKPMISLLKNQKFTNPVVIIPTKKRVNGKKYRTYVSKKVPRDRTLTAVFYGYLDDILYPATIVGKRIRYPSSKTRVYKVLVDPLEKEIIEYKLDALTACYRTLTNRKLEISILNKTKNN